MESYIFFKKKGLLIRLFIIFYKIPVRKPSMLSFGVFSQIRH